MQDAPPPHVRNSKEKLRQFVRATNPGPQKGATTGRTSTEEEEQNNRPEE